MGSCLLSKTSQHQNFDRVSASPTYHTNSSQPCAMDSKTTQVTHQSLFIGFVCVNSCGLAWKMCILLCHHGSQPRTTPLWLRVVQASLHTLNGLFCLLQLCTDVTSFIKDLNLFSLCTLSVMQLYMEKIISKCTKIGAPNYESFVHELWLVVVICGVSQQTPTVMADISLGPHVLHWL